MAGGDAKPPDEAVLSRVNACSLSGETPLHAAASQSHVVSLRALLRNGGDPGVPDKSGNTALHVACLNGCTQAATLLKEQDPGLVSRTNRHGDTPIHFAAREGHTDTLRAVLVHSFDKSLRNESGETPFDLALAGGHLECADLLATAGTSGSGSGIARGYHSLVGAIAKRDQEQAARLIANGADVNAVSVEKWAPIHEAALRGTLILARLLVHRGARVAVKDRSGATPLHAAARCPSEDVIRFLLQNGAQVSETDNDGQTPLMLAAAAGGALACDFLVASGAAVTASDRLGRTAMHHAAAANKIKCLSVLLGHGSPLDSRTRDGLTPLHAACDAGAGGAVEFLLRHVKGGTDLSIAAEAKDNHRRCPIHLAAARGRVDAVRVMARLYPDSVRLVDGNGSTPLHLAVEGDQADTVDVLLSVRSDVDAADKNLHTPLHVAVMRNNDTTCEMLLKAWARLDVMDRQGVAVRQLAQRVGARGCAQLMTEEESWRSSSGLTLPEVRLKYNQEFLKAVRAGDADAVVATLERRIDLNVVLNRGATALQECARSNASVTDVRKVMEILLQRGADPRVPGDDGTTALHVAAQSGRPELLPVLIDAGADPDQRSSSGATAFHIACSVAALDCMEVLRRRGCDMALPDNDKVTPLLAAAQRSQTASVDWLLRNKADPNAPGGPSAITPLHAAVATANDVCVGLLLRHGADPTAASADGTRPIHVAALGPSVNVLRLLLSAPGADVDTADMDGCTAVHLASGKGNTEVLEFLLAHGDPDVTAQDRQGLTPLHMAAAAGQVEAMNLLLAANSPVDPQAGSENDDVEGGVQGNLETPLHMACQAGEVEAVKVLLEYNAEISATTVDGFTPLHYAAANGHAECMELILARGGEGAGDVDPRDARGATPLAYAAASGSPACVRLLLDRFADVNACALDGSTALHAAHSADDGSEPRREVLNLLIAKGAANPSTAGGGGRAKRNASGYNGTHGKGGTGVRGSGRQGVAVSGGGGYVGRSPRAGGRVVATAGEKSAPVGRQGSGRQVMLPPIAEAEGGRKGVTAKGDPALTTRARSRRR